MPAKTIVLGENQYCTFEVDATEAMGRIKFDGTTQLGVLYPEYVMGQPITVNSCLLYTSPSPRDRQKSRMPSSA